MTEKDTDERQNALLTKKDREWLAADKPLYTGDSAPQQRYRRRRSIQNRVRSSLRDFRLLADELPAEERDKIFAATEDPRDEEYGELHKDVEKAIKFFYTGMGGETGFREALEAGVRTGELELGNISHGFDIVPRFTVDTVRRKDERAVLEAIKNEEWGELTSPPALLAFIKTAVHADAVDLDAVSERINLDEYVLENRDAIQEFNQQQQNDSPDDK